MLGTIEQGHTLVVTEDDYLAFSRRLPVLSAVLTAYFATRTLLFLCHDLEDAAFKQLYVQLVANLGEHARHAYAVLPGCTNYQVQYWAAKGLQLIDADPEAFVEALGAIVPPVAVPAHPVEKPTEAPLPKRPFKFLDYYDTADADIFFGRQHETRDLAQLALSHRLVVLTGASGTGKTSLVRAGVVPLLDHQGCLTAVVRVGDDPVVAIIEGLRRMVPGLSLPANASLLQAVQAAEAQSERVLVIIIDQFEEFFVRLGQPTQERFIDALAACLAERDARLGTRFVLSLRSDFFVQLQALRSRIPGVFHNTYEVQRLTPQQARLTIAGPLQAVGLDVDPGLVDSIVTDLDLEGIDPPQLQIVCDRLYQKAMDADSPVLTIDLYRRLGGAERILNDYLDNVLARLPQADQSLAREILKALVTSHDTKDRRTADDLAQSLAAPAADVTRVADDLVHARLLRRIDRAYELVHDYLVRRVREWLDQGDRQLKEVQEMLRREVDGWRTRRLSLSRAELRLIATCSERDRLRPSADELALIAYSAVLHDMNADVWLARVSDPGAVLLLLLGDEDPVARQRAAARLATHSAPGVGDALVRLALTDPAPAVRQAAARSLGELNDGAGLARLVQAAHAAESRGPAVAALAQARDAGTRWAPGLDGMLRLRAQGQLALIRLERSRWRILYEAVGGALGGALGLSLG
ncbi:MAG: SIR2 family protein, partial [Chloroflexi bacterium]|nr:SIR2 family protein [Chloroflexota bacterium]